MAKPKIPSERPPVAVDEDRWDISDDPAPSLSAPVAPSAPPPPDPAAPTARANDPLRTTLALGNMPLPAPPATGVPSAGASQRPPSSAPGPVGAHREVPPTPTLALESKALHQMLVAKAAEASAARAAIEAAKATPSTAPPSAGVPATAKARVGSTTLALDDAPPIKAPSSAALPGHSSSASKSERPATATMVFSPSELVKAASDKSKERVGSSTLALEPNAPPQPPAAQGPSSAGRIGAPAANLSKTMVQGALPSSAPVAASTPAKPSSDASVNLRGTLVMAAPLAARPADPAPSPAQQGPALTPTQAITQPKREAPAAKAVPHVSAPKDALSSTIVGMSPLAPPSASTALHAAPASAAKGPAAAAKSAPAPLDSLSQTLVGTSPVASITDAVLSEKSQPDSTADSTLGASAPAVEPAPSEPEIALDPARSSALPAPAALSTATLRDGSPDASARTTTTPHALAATLAHEPIEEKADDLGESYVSSPITRLPADETGRAAKEPARDSKPAEPRASRPVIAARTPASGVDLPKKPASQPQSMVSASQERATEDEEQLEVGESALRVALAAAGTIVVSSAVPTLVRDPIGAATWTIPGVIALVLAFVPVGHATRALLAFAPALPALAVRAMGCEGHSVPGALALTALAAGLPAALLFRAYFAGLKRARALVAAALVIGAVWALLPGGGGVLGPTTGPWAASHLPALSFLAVAALSVTALLPGRSAGGAGGWALLAIAWTALPALGSRAEQFGPRALDALSLAGLSAIASTTLAGLLSVYALPEQAEPAQQ